jgi:hypothetical protein
MLLQRRSRGRARSASIATSCPILLRYWKQSATVFAGENAGMLTP